MAAADGKITIDTTLNTDPLQKGIRGIKNQFSGLKSAVGGLAKTLAAGFAIGSLINFGKECAELGSNVQEVQNVVDAAFGDMSYKVEVFAKTSIQKFGMSQLAAKKTASTYMAMAKNMGLSADSASDMAITLAGLTGDVASFYNISQELADIKLKSVFTGETETLKDLGIVMTQDNLAAYALAQGIEKSLDQMTQAEKVVLRYNFVLDNLALATGDFAKTSDSWANQTRILSMQWQELMSILGQSLITILTPLVRGLNSITTSLINVANTANSVISQLFGGTNTQLSVTKGSAEDIAGAIGESASNQNDLTEATKETAKAQKGLIAGFDEINKLSETSALNETAVLDPLTQVDVGVNADQIEGSTEKVKGILEGITSAIQPTADAIKSLWDALQPVGNFSGSAIADFYENALKPIGEWHLSEGLPRFVSAIKEGLATVNWQNINDSLNALWTNLTPFSVFVGEGLLMLWEKVLVPLGAWTMNEAVPLFLDGVAVALGLFNEVWESAKPALEWLWNNFLLPIAEWTGGVFVAVFGEVVNLMRDLSAAISGEKTMADFFGDLTPLETALLRIGAGLASVAVGMAAVAAIKGLTEAFGAVTTFVQTAQKLNATGLFGKLYEVFLLASGGAGTLHEALQLVFGPGSLIGGIAAIIGGAVLAITNFLSMLKGGFNWVNEALMLVGIAIAAVGAIILGAPWVVASVIAAIVAALATAVIVIKENWESVKLFFTNLWNGVCAVASGAWEAIKKVFAPVVEWFGILWGNVKKSISDIFYNIGVIASGCWEVIKKAWQLVSGWFNTNVITPVSNYFSVMWGKISGAATTAWEGIKLAFSPVVEWFREKFSAAWGAVKQVFSTGGKIFDGIKDGILASLKAVINALIDGINKTIATPFNGLNTALTKIKNSEILGLKPFSALKEITVPKIPKLAQGAVVPPNREFMAILGDNKKETEIVSPLSTMKQALLEALQESGGVGGGTITLVVNLDGKEVARNQVKHINDMTRQAGKPVLLF